MKTRYIDDTYVEYFSTGNHDLAQIYLKSEADKVIAELKQQIEVLQKEKKIIQDLYLGERDDCRIWAARAIHNKYKRCLAMAEMCEARYDEEDAKVNGCGASWEYISKEIKYWERWRNRWLKIAEKFKTNPTINRKEATNAL